MKGYRLTQQEIMQIVDLYELGLKTTDLETQFKRAPRTIDNAIAEAEKNDLLSTRDYTARFSNGLRALIDPTEDPDYRSLVSIYVINPLMQKAARSIHPNDIKKAYDKEASGYERLLQDLVPDRRIPFEFFATDNYLHSFQGNASALLYAHLIKTASTIQYSPKDIQAILREGILNATARNIQSLYRLTDEQREKIDDLLDRLTPRERRVINLRYGIPEGNRAYLDTIGELEGLSSQRISQLKANALKKLRLMPEINVLDRYAIPAVAKPYSDSLQRRIVDLEEQVNNLRGTLITVTDERLREMREIEELTMEFGSLSSERRDLYRKLLSDVGSLPVGVRTHKALMDCRYLVEVIQQTEESLLRNVNFGRKSLEELKEVLAKMGLNLGTNLEELGVNEEVIEKLIELQRIRKSDF